MSSTLAPVSSLISIVCVLECQHNAEQATMDRAGLFSFQSALKRGVIGRTIHSLPPTAGRTMHWNGGIAKRLLYLCRGLANPVRGMTPTGKDRSIWWETAKVCLLLSTRLPRR